MRSTHVAVLLLVTLAAVVSVAAQGPTAQNQLRVGAARVEITPPAAPGSPAPTYEHQRLYVRAIVIDNGTARAAIIGADQGNLPDDVWTGATKAIASELNIPVQHVLMSATHTHSSATVGPGQATGRAGGAAPATPAAPAPVTTNAATPALVAPIVEAVRRANAALQPARMGYGTGTAWLNVNRDAIDVETRQWTQASNLDAYSDKTVGVVKFESTTGRPIAVYFNYAMHPVNAYLSGFVSADFPGAATRHIEQAFGDPMVAIFVQSASGDQNPLHLRAGTNLMASRTGVPIPGSEMIREKVEAPLRDGTLPQREPDPKVRDGLMRWIESLGMVLGEEVIRVMTRTTAQAGPAAIRGNQRMISCAGRTRTGGAREGGPGEYGPSPDVSLRLGALVIGQTAFASVNAEIYSLIGRRVLQQSPLANTMLVTLANGRAGFGYVPDDASYGHYTFQVNGTRFQPGCAETSIANGLSTLISELK